MAEGVFRAIGCDCKVLRPDFFNDFDQLHQNGADPGGVDSLGIDKRIPDHREISAIKHRHRVERVKCGHLYSFQFLDLLQMMIPSQYRKNQSLAKLILHEECISKATFMARFIDFS